MTVEELPLLDLFTQLREAGLPLGIDEYRLVLQALQGGFGVRDRAALKRLCQTLWVKSAEDKRLFDYHFERMISQFEQNNESDKRRRRVSRMTRYLALGGAFILGVGMFLVVGLYKNRPVANPTPVPTLTAKPTQTPELSNGGNELNLIVWGVLSIVVLSSGFIFVGWVVTQINERGVGSDTSVPQPRANAPTSALPPELTVEVEDEVQVAQAVRQATDSDEEIPHSRFILKSDYFPVTRRQMKQSWRYLRRPIREGPPVELDVEATVNQIGLQGLLLEPVLVPRRVNRAELLLLIDRDGSMVPFHTLAERLAETAVRGGRLGQAGIYYFHNCPIDYLYRDPYHQEAESISEMLTRLPERTAVLIFSDAGAARGGYSEERLELTEAFLTQLRQRVRYIAWLNPMPKKRWNGTTAGEIARIVPMFELTRRGLQDAIDALRGRSKHQKGKYNQ